MAGVRSPRCAVRWASKTRPTLQDPTGSAMDYRLLADITAGVHLAYVACVVFGLLLIVVGHFRGWKWVHNRWFRAIHLLMIVGVVIRTLVWTECPLTWWERDLRALAGQVDAEGVVSYEGSAV